MRFSLSAPGGAAKLGFVAAGLIIIALAVRFPTLHSATSAPAVTTPVAVAVLVAAADQPPAPAPNLHPDLPAASAQALNAALPLAHVANPAAKPFVLAAAGEDRARALTCLTQAVYYEAGFEPAAGEQAVAQVVLNRMRHPIFPHSVCGVVYQGAALKTGCQFSFTCDGSLARPPQAAAWDRARRVAEAALGGFVMKGVGEATHYHTQWVVPWWRPSVAKVAQIGAHIFYRWPGSVGLPQAFTIGYSGHERIGATPGAETPAVLDKGLVVEAPKDAAGRVHAVLQMADAAGPTTPRERMRALAAQGLLGADFDPATVRLTPPATAATPLKDAAPGS